MTSPEIAETTLEEDLKAALAEHTGGEAEKAEIEPEIADSELSAPEKGPARGPDGKFAAKEAEEQTGQETETPAEPETPVIPDKFALPPKFATKAIRENWEGLAPDIKRELHEREADFHKQLTKQDEERTFGRQVKQIVAPYENFIRSLGADPTQAVDYLIKTDYALRTAPPEQRKALFMKAAADYGISFDGNEVAPQPVDNRIESFQQRIERLENEQRTAIEQQRLQEQASIEQQIADFASRPENVFFDRVSPLMASLLQSGQADNLEKAYEMAVYADPETRALQQAAKEQAAASARDSAAKAAAEKAKAASVSVTGAPGPAVPSSPVSPNSTIEEDIRAAIAAASSRI